MGRKKDRYAKKIRIKGRIIDLPADGLDAATAREFVALARKVVNRDIELMENTGHRAHAVSLKPSEAYLRDCLQAAGIIPDKISDHQKNVEQPSGSCRSHTDQPDSPA